MHVALSGYQIKLFVFFLMWGMANTATGGVPIPLNGLPNPNTGQHTRDHQTQDGVRSPFTERAPCLALGQVTSCNLIERFNQNGEADRGIVPTASNRGDKSCAPKVRRAACRGFPRGRPQAVTYLAS